MLAEQLRNGTLGTADDDFVIVEWTAEVGTHWIAPLHVHHRDDEAWYVLEGSLGFRIDDEEATIAAGGAVLVRHGTAHTYRNAGTAPARYLLVMPPRIARLVEAIHEPDADIPALFEAHDSALVSA